MWKGRAREKIHPKQDQSKNLTLSSKIHRRSEQDPSKIQARSKQDPSKSRQDPGKKDPSKIHARSKQSGRDPGKWATTKKTCVMVVLDRTIEMSGVLFCFFRMLSVGSRCRAVTHRAHASLARRRLQSSGPRACVFGRAVGCTIARQPQDPRVLKPRFDRYPIDVSPCDRAAGCDWLAPSPTRGLGDLLTRALLFRERLGDAHIR